MATVDTLQVSFEFQHFPITSTNISSAAWSNDVLEVKFRSGYTYRYFGVPEQTYLDLIDPTLKVSKGMYLKKSVEGKVYRRV